MSTMYFTAPNEKQRLLDEKHFFVSFAVDAGKCKDADDNYLFAVVNAPIKFRSRTSNVN